MKETIEYKKQKSGIKDRNKCYKTTDLTKSNY